jgi:putative redox protein
VVDEAIEATATRSGSTTFTHRITTRGHQLTIDEPPEKGGDDDGPTPQELLAASLAGCTAITIEMYAKRKDWDIGPIEVECEYTTPEPGDQTRFRLVLRLPRGLTDEQIQRLRVIAGKCPVHRTLDGDAVFEERVELV